MLPIAYITFFCMMNSKKLLGKHMPTGLNRLKWNVLMLLALCYSVTVCMASIYQSGRTNQIVGFGGLGAIVALAVFVHFRRQNATESDGAAESDIA